MMNNVKKYGVMTIAAVLLVAMAFAGVASAETVNIGSAAEWNAFAGNSANYSKDINITRSFSFNDSTPVRLGSESNPYLGNISGNGCTIWNFVIRDYGAGSSADNLGLIGRYSGTLIKDLTLSDFSVTGFSKVGGLVGYAGSTSGETHIENVRIQYGNVTGGHPSSGTAGGLVGYVTGAIWINASSAEHMYVASGYNVGGLVSSTYSAIHIKDSWVNCSKIYGSSDFNEYGVGGLVGGASSVSMNNASVMDCNIGNSGNSPVGGLVGYADSASDYDGCAVENCTITAYNGAGGLIGYANSASTFTDENWVNATWVGGTSNVGALLGLGISSKTPATATNPLHNNVWGNITATVTSYGNGFDESPKTLDEAKSAGYCSVIDKKSLIAGKDYGNCRAKHLTYAANGATSGSAPASQVYPYNSTVPVVTVAGKGNLAKTDYLFDGWNTAADGSGTPYQPEETFSITADTTLYAQWIKIYSTITNSSGTYSLTSELTTVYGDNPATDGTAVLTFDSESKPVLTLTGFKASNMNGVPIIDASADLTIVLKGESKLTGSFGRWDSGLLTVDGNLTIEGDSSSKLLVDNTNSSSSSRLTSIYVSDNLMIDGVIVTATANSTSGSASSIYAGNDLSLGQDSVVDATANSTSSEACSIDADNDISIGKNSVVNATANSTSGSALSICTDNDIKIESAAKVNANAYGEYNTYALRAQGGNISLGKNSVVEATANSNSSDAYSLYAENDIEIESAKKVTATAETLGSGSDDAYGLNAGGTIAISDSLDVTATATAPRAYSITTAVHLKMVNTQGTEAATYDHVIHNSNIVITNSKVTAKAEGGETAYALRSEMGSITISGDKTVIDANATYTGQAVIDADAICAEQIVSGAGAILANEDITITSAERIKAIGTNSSFVYNGSGYGSLNLNKLADYKFSNASVDGDEPKLYSTFVNPNNWYDSGYYTISNFTAVLIEKKATTPSSSSKHSGSTVIQPNTVDIPDAVDLLDTGDAADTSANLYTVNFSMNGHGIQVINQSVSFGNTAEEPYPLPTADGYTFTGWYTDKGLVSKYAFSTPVTDDIELYAGWTAKTPTSKSPAPFLGIIAGLGVAALALTRMRR